MTTDVSMGNEWAKRMELVEDEHFQKVCADVCKESGITPQEWNDNKATILMHFANQAV